MYRQIAEQILERIDSRDLSAGTRLPPIRELARELRVNRDTVALAYDELSRAGVVESTLGRGTFVTGVPAPDAATAVEPLLSPLAERVLELERRRPRFGSAPGAVPMHSLVPDPALFPVDAFRRALNRVLQQGGADLLLYGGPQGHSRLREVLAAGKRGALSSSANGFRDHRT